MLFVSFCLYCYMLLVEEMMNYLIYDEIYFYLFSATCF